MLILKDVPSREKLKEHASRFGYEDINFIYTMLHFISVGTKMRASAENFFARFQLSTGRFMILTQMMLNPEKGLHPSTLADRLGVSRATITGLLDKLEQDGLIKRAQSAQDKRSVVIHITQAGRNKLEQIMPIRLKQVACIMSSFSDAELTQFNQFLTEVEGKIEASEKVCDDILEAQQDHA